MSKLVGDLVFTYEHNRRINSVMTAAQLAKLKPHQKTKITGKRAYLCSHCRELGHTKSSCGKLLSGNQSIQKAKNIVPGRYIVYKHTNVSDERNKLYASCNLKHPPMELYPDSSPKPSTAEHAIFESITENELKDEIAIRGPNEFQSLRLSTKSCIISKNTKLSPLKKPSQIKDSFYERTDVEYTTNAQKLIELGVDSTVINIRRKAKYNIMKQQYRLEMGSELEEHHQLFPDVDLNSAGLSPRYQSMVLLPRFKLWNPKCFCPL